MKISTKNFDDIVFDKSKMNVCIDFDCLFIIKMRNFIKQQLNDDIKIQKSVSLISIRKVNNKLIKINDFVLINLYIIDVDFIDKFIIVVIIAKIYLINDFDVNMFINVNVLKLQKMLLNFDNNKFIINNCDVQTNIDSIIRFKFYVKRIIRNQKIYIVLSNEIIKISMIFNNDLLINRNFFLNFNVTSI